MEKTVTAMATIEQSLEEHDRQLYLALALLCKGSVLVTVKNTEVNNGLEAWQAWNAAYNSNNRGRQRADAVLVAAETTVIDCSDDRSSREMGM